MKPKPGTVRIDKYIANQGYTSRRKVDDFLKQHDVRVNNRRIQESGERFNPLVDKLSIDNKGLEKPTLVYFLVNKPKGFVSTTTDEHERKTVTNLVKTSERVFPVGRLDIDTQGLILLTNDGDLSFKLTHPRFHIDKTYAVTIAGKLSSKYKHILETGVRLKDGVTAPAKIHTIDYDLNRRTTTFRISIHEGRNRQIRRMCKALNLELFNLTREKIGPLELADLPSGKSRELSESELTQLQSLWVGNNR